MSYHRLDSAHGPFDGAELHSDFIGNTPDAPASSSAAPALPFPSQANPFDAESFATVQIGSIPPAVPTAPESIESGSSTMPPPASQPQPSVFSFAFYQRFFDVTTADVLRRLASTICVWRPLLSEHEKPDLYGPFWVATTLVVVMAAAGSIAQFFDVSGESFDFTKVTVAASCLYFFITVLPLLVWCFLDRIGTDKGLAELISIYGYSLFPYVPSAVLCIAPLNLLRWICVLVSFGFSVIFFLRNLLPSAQLPARNRAQAYMLVFFMSAVHIGVTLLMKLYFFSYVQ